MPTFALLVLSVLWFAALLLAILVLVLYRQVDGALRQANDTTNSGLPAGAAFPVQVEIVSTSGAGGLGQLSLPTGPELALIAFMQPACGACERVGRLLAEGGFKGRVVGLLAGEGVASYARTPSVHASFFGLASPTEATQQFGVTSYPTLLFVQSGMVRASGSVATRGGFEQLLGEANAAAESSQSTPTAQRLERLDV